MTEKPDSVIFHEVPSPFCGIARDDLTIEVVGDKISVLENGDAISQPGFEAEIGDFSPRIAGKKATLAEAIERAAALINSSRQTLVSGLGTDLNGARAAMALADKARATVDHMNSDGSFRNTLVLQDTGWMVTTFTEVRNRADLIVVVGCDIESAFPSFFERMVWPEESLFDQDNEQRQIVYLGGTPSGQASTSPAGKSAQVIPCDHKDLPEVLSVLRALINDKQVQAESVGGIAVDLLLTLATQLKAAKYSVMTWSATLWPFTHAEVSVQTLCELIKDLNKKTRCNGLPLAGKEGDITVNSVASWQVGYPMRTSFNRGFPDHDPFLFNSKQMLANDEVDTLIWVASFDQRRLPPENDANTVVLGRSGMEFDNQPEVYIPIGTPGIDHSGRIFRSDSAVSLPLKQLRKNALPSAFEVLSAIERAL